MKRELWFHGQDFRRATKNYRHNAEQLLSSVLFGDSPCSFLPYSEIQDIAINHFIISLLRWGLSHKINCTFFVLGMKSSGYNSVPKSVISKISQNRLHMWKSWKVLLFKLDTVSKLISWLFHGVCSRWKGLHHLSKYKYKQNHSVINGKYILLPML